MTEKAIYVPYYTTTRQRHLLQSNTKGRVCSSWGTSRWNLDIIAKLYKYYNSTKGYFMSFCDHLSHYFSNKALHQLTWPSKNTYKYFLHYITKVQKKFLTVCAVNLGFPSNESWWLVITISCFACFHPWEQFVGLIRSYQ